MNCPPIPSPLITPLFHVYSKPFHYAFKMSSSTICINSANQFICNALLKKSATYPPTEPWKVKAYRKAAESVATITYDIYQVYNEGGYFDCERIPHIGDSIENFMCNLMEYAHPLLNCTIPQNEPIYDALVEKAASYPPTEPWKAKAYRKAAESVATYGKNIYKDYDEYNSGYHIPNVGNSIEEFIYNFIYPFRKENELKKENELPQTPPSKTTTTVPSVPSAPKKPFASLVNTPNNILKEAMKRMDEAHPEQNIMNILHPMVYGTPYPGHQDKDFDENEPLDEEELTEEEVDRIINSM
jgi:hypothetical protein